MSFVRFVASLECNIIYICWTNKTKVWRNDQTHNIMFHIKSRKYELIKIHKIQAYIYLPIVGLNTRMHERLVFILNSCSLFANVFACRIESVNSRKCFAARTNTSNSVSSMDTNAYGINPLKPSNKTRKRAFDASQMKTCALLHRCHL